MIAVQRGIEGAQRFEASSCDFGRDAESTLERLHVGRLAAREQASRLLRELADPVVAVGCRIPQRISSTSERGGPVAARR
ncbi:MAG: hypothetical protein CMJ83_04075 [Planctomycetes bacterium]|nr:hypothetical protein [Planctomycetota bacterium]